MKTIFKNEEGVATLHVLPETDQERVQMQNVVCKGRLERIFMPTELTVRKMPGGGISVGKCATITDQILYAWGFYEVWGHQFKYDDNRIYQSDHFPHTLLVGRGTYRVFHNVMDYDFQDENRLKLGNLTPMPGKKVRKFVCRAAYELEDALMANEYLKKKHPSHGR